MYDENNASSHKLLLFFGYSISFHHLSKSQSLIEIKIIKKSHKLLAVPFSPQKVLLHLIYWSTRMVVRYDTQVRYCLPQFLRRSTVAGTVPLFCNGTGTVRWYAL